MWNGTASTLGDLRTQISSGANGQRRLTGWVEAIALVLLLVTGATLLLSTVDAMMERRRALAMLTALGADRSLLRRSILVQVGIPLAVATTLGVGVSLLVTSLLFPLLVEPLLLPLTRLATIAGAAVVLVFGVTIAAMPWDRIVRRAELLHGE
jgi:predicted lysophospholipase L1 biosynthesis ABC-type transport system permease subunit